MTSQEPYPNRVPGQAEPPLVESPSPLAVPHNQAQEQALDRQHRRSDRTRMVRTVCTIINVLCGLFAVVLVAHIVTVLGEANPANGVAAIVWLAFGAVITSLIRRFALPNPRELTH